MSSRFRRLGCVIIAISAAIGLLPQPASALDTANMLMGIDAMTMQHAGLFRNGTPNEGFNTFVFGPVQSAPGTLGRYHSFYFVKNAAGDGGVSHNARFHSDTPETADGPVSGALLGLDLDSDYLPLIDRSAFGQLFDPEQYQIEVKFKPNVGVAGLPNNTAPLFGVGLDQQDGFVFDAESGVYKRANDAFGYNIGSAEVPINTWYESAAKDADGFATFTVPVTEPTFIQRGFYGNFGNGDFRTNEMLTGGGRMFNETTQVWEDVNDGLDSTAFGGGPVDPSRPGSQIMAPNGIPLISMGAPNAEAGLSIQVKSVALTKINPGPIVARIDANSGLTFKFGSGFAYGATQPPITVDGFGFSPTFTDQITRFDQNGMTNLIFNMRTPDDPNEVHSFILRGAPNANTFDGTDATVNIRARLLEPLTNPGIAQSLTLLAKDLDGTDMAANQGADEYSFDLALNQFNTSTFTTVSIPLASFLRSGTAPFGFANLGDNSLENFALYEFTGRIPSNGGLLRMELEYLEIRLPEVGLDGDFDVDGDVDGNDFLVWQRGGSPNPMDAGDLADWRANFGMTSSVAAAASVPEPGALLLAACGLAPISRRRAPSGR